MRFTSSLCWQTTAVLALSALSRGAAAQPFGSIITSGIEGCDFQTGKLEAKCIPIFIGHLVAFVFGFLSVLFILNVIYAGYQIAMGYIGEVGGGDKSAGIDRLRWSIIGLVICILSFLIVNIVVSSVFT